MPWQPRHKALWLLLDLVVAAALPSSPLLSRGSGIQRLCQQARGAAPPRTDAAHATAAPAPALVPPAAAAAVALQLSSSSQARARRLGSEGSLAWELLGEGDPEASKDVVRIAAPLSLDCCSRHRNVSQSMYGSLVLFVNWVNQVRGGLLVGGRYRKVQLQLFVDNSSEAVVRSIAQHVLYRRNISFLLGPYGSDLTLELAEAVHNHGQSVLVAPGAAATAVFVDPTGARRQNVFGMLPPASRWLEPIFKAIHAKGLRNISIFAEDNLFARSMCGEVPRLASSYGLTVLGNITLDRNDPETSAKHVAASFAPLFSQVVVGCTYEAACLAFLQAALKRNLGPPVTALTVCSSDPDLSVWEYLGSRWVSGPTPWVNLADNNSTDEWSGWTSSGFADFYHKYFGKKPTYQAASMFAGALALARAIEEANSTEPLLVSGRLQNMSPSSPASSILQTVAFDSQGQNSFDLGMVQAQNDDIVPRPVTPETFLARPRQVVRVLGLTSLSGANPEPPHGPKMNAVQWMLDEVNGKQELLPSLELNVTWEDDGCQPTIALQNMNRRLLEVCHSSDVYVAVVGPVCSRATQSVAMVTDDLHLVHISAVSTAAELSDRNLYPHFFRTIVPDTEIPMVWLRICYAMYALRGTQASALNVAFLSGGASIDWPQVQRAASELNMEIMKTVPDQSSQAAVMVQVVPFLLWEAGNSAVDWEESNQVIRPRIQDIMARHIGIVLLSMYPEAAACVMCNVAALNDTFRPLYLVPGWWLGNWWETHGSCALTQAWYHVAVAPIPTVHNKQLTCLPGYTLEDVRKRFGVWDADLGNLLDAFCALTLSIRKVMIEASEESQRQVLGSARTYNALNQALQAVNFVGGADENFSFAPNSSDPVGGTILVKQAIPSQQAGSGGLTYMDIELLELRVLRTGRGVEAMQLFTDIVSRIDVRTKNCFQTVELIALPNPSPQDAGPKLPAAIVLAGSLLAVLVTFLVAFAVVWRHCYLENVDRCYVFAHHLIDRIASIQYHGTSSFAWALLGSSDPVLVQMDPSTDKWPHPVYVLVCVDGPYEIDAPRVAKAVQELCLRERLAQHCIRCFVITPSCLAETFTSGAAYLTERSSAGNDKKTHKWFTKKLNSFARTHADMLPIFCDICTYCLLVIDENIAPSVVPTASFSMVDSGRPSRDQQDQQSDRFSVCMMAGLVASVLKADGNTFVYQGPKGDPGAVLSPHTSPVRRRPTCSTYRRTSPELIALTAEESRQWGLSKYFYDSSCCFDTLPTSIDSVPSSGCLLSLWCLALSHGSGDFHRKAFRWLRALPALQEMDPITNNAHWWYTRRPCRRGCVRWHPPAVSLATTVRSIFLTSLRLVPVTPSPSQLLAEIPSTCREPRRRRRLSLTEEEQARLHGDLRMRRTIVQAQRVRLHLSDFADNFALQHTITVAPFLLPVEHPCARHLKQALDNLKWLVEVAGPSENNWRVSQSSGETARQLGVGHRILPQLRSRASGLSLASSCAQPSQTRQLSPYDKIADNRTTPGSGSRQPRLSGLSDATTTKPSPKESGTATAEDIGVCEAALLEAVRRIQLYLLAYLRKMNSAQCEQQAQDIERASRELYVHMVEAYAELVGPVRAHLCDKAESRTFQELIREVVTEMGEGLVPSESSPVIPLLGFSSEKAGSGSSSDSITDSWTCTPGNARPIVARNGADLVKFFRTAAQYQQDLQALVEDVAENVSLAAAVTEGAPEGSSSAAYVDRDIWAPKSIWRLVEESTWQLAEEKIRQQPGLADCLADGTDRGELRQLVDDALVCASEEAEFGFPTHHVKCAARSTVVCRNFRVMLIFLRRLRLDRRLIVSSVKNRWAPARWRFPHILCRLEFNGTGLASFVPGQQYMEVRVTHEKIAAVFRGEYGRDPRYNVCTIRSMFKALHFGDPENHPSMWCITLGQLRGFAQMAEAKLGPDVYSSASTLDIVKDVVQPATQHAGRSYACMMNWRQLRQVDVFISHAWLENFSTFVGSVEKALENRVRADEVNLWICSFALFQCNDPNKIKAQIGKDLCDAPFEKALQRAKEFLVVRNSEIDLYTRAWCAYEVFRATQLGIKISVTGPDTFMGGSVDIMTCTATDQEDEQRIKDAIREAGEVEALNKIVTEIKAIKKPS